MRAGLLLAASLSLGIVALAACDGPPAPPPATPEPEPALDVERLKSRLAPEQTLQVIGADGPVHGRLEGWRAPVYAIQVAAGQTLDVELEGEGVFVNLGDAADPTGAPLHRGESDGPRARVRAGKPTVYFIAPYQPPEASRAARRADFTLVIGRSAAQ